MSEWLEFRPDHKGRFDEIVARFSDGGTVYVETLSSRSVFIGFYRPDIGEVLQFWISAAGKLTYHHERSKDEPPVAPALVAMSQAEAEARGLA